MLGNFSCCLLLTFFKINFSKKIPGFNTIRVSNCLGPDQDGHSVSPDLATKCLQRLSANEKKSPLAWNELKFQALIKLKNHKY